LISIQALQGYIGDRFMEDEEGQKTEGNAPRKSRTGDDRGDVLFIFRPSYHFLRILGWVIMAVIIISYTALFLGSFASEPDFLILMLGTLAIFPFFLFVLYMSYLAAFDNIVVYEYGLVPPLVSEGSINIAVLHNYFLIRT